MKNKLKSFSTEFKEFISRGNVVDLAVGVIMGGAFGKIVTSLVNDIIMPLVGIILGGLDFTNLKLTLGEAEITYGLFIQNVIDFLIVSACIFVMIKFINKFTKKKEAAEKKEEVKEEPKKSEEVLLLEEIRDLLKNQNKKSIAKITSSLKK